MTELKGIKEYTERQEKLCLGLVNRISAIQLRLLGTHASDQIKSFIDQPKLKYGLERTPPPPKQIILVSPSSPPKSSEQLINNRKSDYSINNGPTSTNTITGNKTTFLSRTPDNFESSNSNNNDFSSKCITLPINSSNDDWTKEESLLNKMRKKRRRNLLDAKCWKESEIDDFVGICQSFETAIHQTASLNKDLDETESSSGNSSCDDVAYWGEDVDTTAKDTTHYLPVHASPLYKFAAKRARIISTWTWIQDAVANLKYKKKQQEEFARYLKQTKPSFQFDENPSSIPTRILPSRQINMNSPLKDATIQVFTHDSNSKPSAPPSRKVFYTAQNQPYITDASGNIIQHIEQHSSTAQVISGTIRLSSDSTPEFPSRSFKEGDIVGGGLESLGLKIPTNPDPTCTARRCLPLKPFKQRKIYQLGGIHNTANYSGKTPSVHCTCFNRTELCAVCTGRLKKIRSVDEAVDKKEMFEILEPTYQRCLSMPEEAPIHVRVESALKLESWTSVGERVKNKFKKVVLKDRRSRLRLRRVVPSPSVESDDKKRRRGRPPGSVKTPQHPPPSTTTNYESNEKNNDNYSTTNILPTSASSASAASRLNSTKRKYHRSGLYERRNSFSESGESSLRVKRRKPQSLSLSSKKGDESDDDEYFEGDYNPFSNDDEFNPSSNGTKLIGKRSSQSGRKLNQDYDIDNIVIPYSIASATRVEKIEYKEILTPSWRVAANYDPDSTPVPNQRKLSSVESFEEGEDVSEDTIRSRHDRCEVEEHKKFNSIPDKHSRRGRRLDSRAESFDPSSNPVSPLTPDCPDSGPISPLTLGDGRSSPLPLPDFIGGTELALRSSTRRRTISTASKLSKEDMEEESDSLEYSNNMRPKVPPFELRQFPLSDDEYQKMLHEMPLFEDEPLEKCSRRSISNSVPDGEELGISEGRGKGGYREVVNKNELSGLKEEGEEESDEGGDDPDWNLNPHEQ